MSKNIELHYGGVRYSLPPPEWDYEVSIYAALHHAPVLPNGYRIWDDGVANDFRTCKATFLLSATDTNTLRDLLKDSARGVSMTLNLRKHSGFFPGGPDKGDYGHFGIRVTAIEAAPVLEEPWLYFRTTLSFVIESYPAYTLPSQIADGDLTIGTVTQLRYPPNFPQSSSEYHYTTQLTRDGTPYTVSKLTNSYETVLPMVCNQSKAAALVDHLVSTVRGDDVTVVGAANSYLFGQEPGDSGSFTCQWISNTIKIRHSRLDEFEFDLPLSLSASTSAPVGKCYVWGVRIYLRDNPATNADIGLYAVGGSNSELRWIEEDLTAYAPTLTWKSGILAPEWISDQEESADWGIGGDLPSIGGGTIKATNTLFVSGVQTQLDRALEDLGINLCGLTVELTRFEIVSGALVDAGGSVRHTLKTGNPSWTETEFSIPMETARLSRKSNLTTQIDETSYPDASDKIVGQTIPLTIGNHSLAYAQRVADSETVLSERDVFGYGWVISDENYAYPILLNFGPGDENHEYQFQTANLALRTIDISPSYYFARIVRGTHVGLVKRITRIYHSTGGAGYDTTFNIVFADYFTDALDTTDWFEIVEVADQSALDTWPCEGFKDENGNAVSEPRLYTVDSKIVTEIPPYVYDAVAGGNNNAFVYQNGHLGSTISGVEYFKCLPVREVGLCNYSTLTSFALSGEAWASFTNKAAGIYSDDAIAPVLTEYAGFGADKAYDGDGDTYYHLSYHIPALPVGNHGRVAVGIVFKLPTLPDDFDFTNLYLGINLDVSLSAPKPVESASAVQIRYRDFRGTAEGGTEILASATGATFPSEGVVRDTVDSYENPGVSTLSRYLMKVDTGATISGYTAFPFTGISNKGAYNTIQWCAIIIYIDVNYATAYDLDIKLYELYLMMKASVDTNVDRYTPFAGRVFNDTWGARKTAAALIENPIDVAEHVLRLQDWSETGEVADWGHAYATSPLIDTSTSEGGFDHEDLDDIKTYKVARQIRDFNEGYSDVILRSLARGFFLSFHQDPTTGNERVSFIGDKALSDPSTTITLSDIIGPIGNVIAVGAENIYAEPFVKYGFNPATNEFGKIIKIIRTDAATFDPSYVIGATGTDAEMLWTKAHVLRLAVNAVEPPPQDMTEHVWIYEDGDAIGYLDMWLTYMGAVSTDGTVAGITYQRKKRLVFSTPYEIGADWFIGKHIKLSLPHQTNSQATEGVIESIRQSYVRGKELTTVRVMLYNYTADIALYVQDTMDTGTLLADWQDHMQTQAERGEGGADIQDI